MDVSYEDGLELSTLPRLDQRRNELFQKFTTKCFNAERFRNRWFTDKTASGYHLRRELQVVEERARCDRLQNAPTHRMRKMVNETR